MFPAAWASTPHRSLPFSFCLLLAVSVYSSTASAQVNSGSTAAGTIAVNDPSWNGGTGNWSDPSKWTPTGVPDNGAAVVIGGQSSTVNLDVSPSISTLSIDLGDALNILDSHVIGVSGNISNAGNISLNSAGFVTELTIAGNVTMSGGGTLTMGNNVNNRINSSDPANIFTNQETIQGAGAIGGMVLVNTNTINANQPSKLFINPTGSTPSTNSGFMEATSGGTLVFTGGNFLNNGGFIRAGSGSTVMLENNTTITGGTLSGTGTIQTVTGFGGAILDGSTSQGAVTNIGNFVVNDASSATLLGNIINAGTLQMNASAGASLLVSGNVNLTGGGALTLSNSVKNVIGSGSGTSTLTTDNTISGAGEILAINVNNSGTINANQTNKLTISALAVTNSGTLEATNGGTLVLDGSLGRSVNNTAAGVIEALNATVLLQGGVNISGGTLTTIGNGVIASGTGISVLNTLTNSGSYTIRDGGFTELQGTIINNGTINVSSTGSSTFLGPAFGGTTLAGSGKLVLSNNSNNVICCDFVLTNQQTIEGAGRISARSMTLNNQNTIIANDSTPLLITTGGSIGGVTNTGTLEATDGANLQLQANSGGGIFNNTNGTIAAIGAGSVVSLLNGATVTGGTLSTSMGGMIKTASGTSATLDSAANMITNSGTYVLDDNSTTTLLGTLNNTGTLNLNSAGRLTVLKINGNVTLTGGGMVTLSENANNLNVITGTLPTDTFTNANNTISGVGDIGNGNMALVNQAGGTINANKSSNPLFIRTSDGVTNTGTLEATNGGTLILNGDTYINAGGTIQAFGLNSKVSLQGATIKGGTLSGVGTAGGVIEVASGPGSTIDGSSGSGAVNNLGSLTVQDNSSATLLGTINNTGTITLNSIGNTTQLRIGNASASNVKLTGGGNVTLSDNLNNFIVGAVGSNTLTNVDNTISGSGNIGRNSMALANFGTINANQSSNLLVIQTSNGVENIGILQATNGGRLILFGDTYKNAGGVIEASGAGSQVLLEAGVTVNGGTLSGTSGGVVEVPTGNTATLSNLTNSGQFTLSDGSKTLLLGTISNSGTIKMDSNGGVTIAQIGSPNTTIMGAGALVMSNNANNEITGAPTMMLTIGNNLQGSGTIDNIGVDVKGTIFNGNIVPLIIKPSPIGLNVEGALNTGPGSMTVIDAADGGGLNNYNGTTNTLTNGAFNEQGTLQFRFSSVDIKTNTANITLNGAGSGFANFSGPDPLANFADNSGSFTIENGRDFASGGDFESSGAVTITGSTFMTGSGAANNYTQNGPSSLTEVGGGGILSTNTLTLNNGILLIDLNGKVTATNVTWSGGTLVLNGTLDPATLTVCAACVLSGTGSLLANVNMSGTIAPGSLGPPSSPGTLSIQGGYTQVAGLFDELINNSGNGLLSVNGAVLLGGTSTLDIGLLNGFTPTIGQTFDIMNFTPGDLSGAFASILDDTFNNGTEKWVIDYNNAGGEILLQAEANTTAPTPEPASLLLLSSGLLASGYVSRRKLHRRSATV